MARHATTKKEPSSSVSCLQCFAAVAVGEIGETRREQEERGCLQAGDIVDTVGSLGAGGRHSLAADLAGNTLVRTLPSPLQMV